MELWFYQINALAINNRYVRESDLVSLRDHMHYQATMRILSFELKRSQLNNAVILTQLLPTILYISAAMCLAICF